LPTKEEEFMRRDRFFAPFWRYYEGVVVVFHLGCRCWKLWRCWMPVTSVTIKDHHLAPVLAHVGSHPTEASTWIFLVILDGDGAVNTRLLIQPSMVTEHNETASASIIQRAWKRHNFRQAVDALSSMTKQIKELLFLVTYSKDLLSSAVWEPLQSKSAALNGHYKNLRGAHLSDVSKKALEIECKASGRDFLDVASEKIIDKVRFLYQEVRSELEQAVFTAQAQSERGSTSSSAASRGSSTRANTLTTNPGFGRGPRRTKPKKK